MKIRYHILIFIISVVCIMSALEIQNAYRDQVSDKFIESYHHYLDNYGEISEEEFLDLCYTNKCDEVRFPWVLAILYVIMVPAGIYILASLLLTVQFIYKIFIKKASIKELEF